MKEEAIREFAGLLVVEDDPHVAGSLERGLREEGFSVAVAGRLAAADAHLARQAPALVVLDLNLPDGDGRAWLRRVRSEGHRMPVVILTARDTLPERVAGLEQGADDYLTKPFAFAELLARVAALLRRGAAPAAHARLKVADLELDRLSRRVTRAGRVVELTTKEFQLLELLMERAGQVVTRTMMLERVWDLHFDPQTNLIDVHMSRLRQAVEGGTERRLIHTLRGAGYVIREAP